MKQILDKIDSKDCLQCKKTFYKKSKWAWHLWNQSKFCSRECFFSNIKGKPRNWYLSEEHKKRLSEIYKGKHFSLESRKKMSIAVNKYYTENPLFNLKKNIFESWTPESLWVIGMLVTDGWVDDRGVYFSGTIEDLTKIQKIWDTNISVFLKHHTIGDMVVIRN